MSIYPPLLDFYSNDLFTPVYQPFKGQRWEVRLTPMILCRGYWSPARMINNMAALLRLDSDGGGRTWMSMTPMEIESQEIGCRHAVGHVVVMGMGMGWAVANAALRPEVSRVTVVEYDPEVIDLIAQLGVFAQLPPDIAAKISVVQGDAYAFVPDSPADTLLADIWLPLFGADRDAEVRRMRDNCRAVRVYFWGQEMVIAHRARNASLALTRTTLDKIVADMDLPLIGPAEYPDYPQKIEQAAQAWLRSPPGQTAAR